ncbi:unnamed protein product [Nesidiocoris tenuis]|uniref:Uncharacterized protein n=1 Tax=Nesidiocoris tenuis TaxID=355587 RepID=A0A6H5H8W4_9HEMI|nr:unnamed protein product [Nesidiocoris tenuis]
MERLERKSTCSDCSMRFRPSEWNRTDSMKYGTRLRNKWTESRSVFVRQEVHHRRGTLQRSPRLLTGGGPAVLRGGSEETSLPLYQVHFKERGLCRKIV